MQAKSSLKKGINIYRQLSPSDRIWVSKELAKELKPLPVSMIKRLARALGFGLRQPKLFLSHSHQDKRFARALARKLEDHGIGVWLDEAELNVGDSLLERLSDAVYDVDFLLAVISKASVKSSWVNEELHMAMTRQIEHRRIIVLPLMKEECKLPKFLKGRIYADFRTTYKRKRNFSFLMDSIVSHYTKSEHLLNSLNQWLEANHVKLFNRREAAGKEYVVVQGCPPENILFISNKRELLKYLRTNKHPLTAYSCRHARKMELLY